MSWEDAAQLESRLKHALEAFEWEHAAAICKEIVDRIKGSEDQIPEPTARRMLADLRGMRRFGLMRSLAEAIIQSGVTTCRPFNPYAPCTNARSDMLPHVKCSGSSVPGPPLGIPDASRS